MNFKSWITEYYTIYRALELKPTTIKSYLRNLSAVPNDWEYETLELAQVQKLINTLALDKSASTVKHIFQIIREPLENGVRYGLPDRVGKLYAIRLPKMHKKLVNALTDEELRSLWPVLKLSAYADAYEVLLGTGIRYCELAGLNCGDFIPGSSTLKIQRRYYRGALASATKTDSGIRVIPVNADIKAVLMRNWTAFRPKTPLFCSVRGNRLSYNTLIHEWHKICDRAKIERCGLHVLRHTFATRLLEKDVSLKIVSTLLGHKSITVTADIYCDVSMALKKAAVDKLVHQEAKEAQAE